MGFFTVRRKRITSGARITTVIATYMNRSPKARWRRDLHDMRLDIGIVGGRVALTLAIEVIADTHAGEQKQQHEEARDAAYSTAKRRGCRRSGGQMRERRPRAVGGRRPWGSSFIIHTAVAYAIFALTGKPPLKLPIKSQMVSS